MLILLLAIAAIVGCRGTRQRDVWQSVLDAEKRALEDRAYELESEADSLRDQLAATRRENDALRKELDRDASSARPSTPPLRAPKSFDEPVIELNESTPAEAMSGRGLAVLNTATGSSVVAKERQNTLPEPAPSLAGLANLGALGGRTPAAPEDDRVVAIELNPMLTGGEDLNNAPGHEGLSVVIEPQNIDGAYVPQAGSVSVVLLDPELSGSAARVARWDFDIGEAQSRLKQSALGRGIHLSLPWPNRPPQHERLHLFVRYTTADQRRLEADREIQVDLPGKFSARWTPAAAAPGPRESVLPMVTAREPKPAAVVSPYAASQQTPFPQPAISVSDSLEAHRVDVAHRDEETAASTPPAEPAKKLERPQWRPYR